MRIIIADSNNLIRIGLRTIFSSLNAIEIIGEAQSSEELLECIKNFDVDIIVIDYTSENFEIDVIPKILSQKPTIRILAVTPEQSAPIIVEALRSGVQSYVKKDCDVAEILDAVKGTANGEKFFCGQILETI